MFPAWLWVHSNTLKIVSVSHNQTLSTDHAIKTRDVLKSEKFQRLYPHKIIFKGDQDNKTYYQNINNGVRMATSVGGGPTGFHFHLIIFDDPQNPTTANSEAERFSSNEFVFKTMPTRKINKKNTPSIYVMQRLHEEDSTGILLEKAKNGKVKIKHICIPATDELDNIQPPKLRMLYKDGLMDPNRMDREVLRNMAELHGSHEYTGQFLQSPQAAGGNIFKREWFKLYEELPLNPNSVIQSWDTGFKTKEENDPSAMLEFSIYNGGIYITDFFNERLEFPQLKQTALQKWNGGNRKANGILIEDKASGQSLIQELVQTTTMPILPFKPDRDKIARANAVSATVEAGNIYIPINAVWVDAFLTQICGFPNAKHDDIVDAFTQFLNWYREKSTGLPPIRARKPRASLTDGYR